MSTNRHTATVRSPRPGRPAHAAVRTAGGNPSRFGRAVRVAVAAGLAVSGFVVVTSATDHGEPAPAEATLFWPDGGGNVTNDIVSLDLSIHADLRVIDAAGQV